jgi:signal transduction histidine kinase
VLLRVADTGRGIPADKREAVFEPFVQVGKRYAGEAPGTGLGLAVSRELARGMGGDLTVESTEGRGATFTVTLRRVVTADGRRTDRRSQHERRDADRRVGADRRADDVRG